MREDLLHNFGMLDGFVADARRVVRRLRPLAALSFEANAYLTAALFDAARDETTPTVVANHNSHRLGAGARADAVTAMLAGHRYANQTVDVACVWSPDNEMTGYELTKPSGRPALVPFRAGPAKPIGCRPADGTFRILHAGNFQGWRDYFPWISETSEEYLSGIRTLAEAAADLRGIHVTVRCRYKDECDPSILQSLLSASPSVEVVGAEEDFQAQLSRYDLLVCHFSTTAAQALQIGVPLLLWGNTQRYMQFPARTVPPTEQERAPVYAVRNAEQLAEMLVAIRQAHQDRPLDSHELAEYRWPVEVMTAKQLAKAMLDGGLLAHRAGAESNHRIGMDPLHEPN